MGTVGTIAMDKLLAMETPPAAAGFFAAFVSLMMAFLLTWLNCWFESLLENTDRCKKDERTHCTINSLKTECDNRAIVSGSIVWRRYGKQSPRHGRPIGEVGRSN